MELNFTFQEMTSFLEKRGYISRAFQVIRRDTCYHNNINTSIFPIYIAYKDDNRPSFNENEPHEFEQLKDFQVAKIFGEELKKTLLNL